MSRTAAFLDRDGTIIRDTGFIASPASVELLPNAAPAIRQLNESGVPVIVITNQSGLARGYFSMDDYEAVRQRVDELLASWGAHIDATLMCPHHPDVTGECECRKPATLLYREAAAAFDLDLGASWFVGDRLRDVLPAHELGGHGILVPAEDTPASDVARARREFTVEATLDGAARRVVVSAA